MQLNNFSAHADTNKESLDKILGQFLSVRSKTEQICHDLEVEDMVVQPVPHVSPPKWHLAHTTWFFEEMILCKFLPGYQKYNSTFSQLFNSYYKSVGKHWRQEKRGILSRPTVSDIYKYRKYVDQNMTEVLGASVKNDSDFLSLQKLAQIGLQHEQQHQELLFMDIKFILFSNPNPPMHSTEQKLSFNSCSKNTWVDFGQGLYQIGFKGKGFSFDNERPDHKAYVYPFAVRENFVTNREYIDFINDQGYAKPQYWKSDGWDWVTKNKIRKPLYWYENQGQWWEYNLNGLEPVIDQALVSHISFYEADAFAAWKGCRLPTEQEAEIYLRRLNPVADYEKNKSEGLSQKAGPLWFWTQSQYSPYPRYSSFSGNLSEYNSKFMCNQFVLKGGCKVTPENHYRDTYRNFYPANKRWMFSGVKLAKDGQ